MQLIVCPFAGRSDFIWVDEDTASLIVYGNAGQGSDIEWKMANGGNPINTGTCQLQRLKFAKLTTSGKPDYICIDDATGRVDAWFNGGPDSSAAHGWKWTGPTRISEKLPGGTRDSILFADINVRLPSLCSTKPNTNRRYRAMALMTCL